MITNLVYQKTKIKILNYIYIYIFFIYLITLSYLHMLQKKKIITHQQSLKKNNNTLIILHSLCNETTCVMTGWWMMDDNSNHVKSSHQARGKCKSWIESSLHRHRLHFWFWGALVQNWVFLHSSLLCQQIPVDAAAASKWVGVGGSGFPESIHLSCCRCVGPLA